MKLWFYQQQASAETFENIYFVPFKFDQSVIQGQSVMRHMQL